MHAIHTVVVELKLISGNGLIIQLMNFLFVFCWYLVLQNYFRMFSEKYVF